MNLLLLAALAASRPARAADDSKDAVQRIAFTLNVAAGEYAKGVRGGRIFKADEYEEATGLIRQAREEFERAAKVRGLDEFDAGDIAAELETLDGQVRSKAEPASVKAEAERLGLLLGRTFGVATKVSPERPPSPTLGRLVYASRCSMCHGDAGDGRGPAAAGLTTEPFKFTNRGEMSSLSPAQLWQVVTLGVKGTAMISWADRLSEQERWDVVSYLWTFPTAPESVERGRTLRAKLRDRLPAAFQNSEYWTETSDDDAVDAARAALPELPADDARRLVAFERLGGSPSKRAAVEAASPAAVMALVRDRLKRSVERYEAGSRDEAVDAAMDAYLGYEPVEGGVTAQDPTLGARLEASFSQLRGLMAREAAPRDVEQFARQMIDDLDAAAAAAREKRSPWMLFLQSLTIMIREGVEALLVLVAITAYLQRAGYPEKRRFVYRGAALAVLASFATAWLLTGLLSAARFGKEALEGITMLAAAGFLFYVSNWLLAKIEARRWKEFIEGRLRGALSGGSLAALSMVAFLAVYREGFETVLFYRALFDLAGGTGGPVWLGLAAGTAALAALFVGMLRFGVRIPIRPFFVGTSSLLFVLGFSFVGQGAAELQGAGWLPATTLAWLPSFPLLSLHPTVETTAAQLAFLLAVLAAVLYAFLIEPSRHMRRELKELRSAADGRDVREPALRP